LNLSVISKRKKKKKEEKRRKKKIKEIRNFPCRNLSFPA